MHLRQAGLGLGHLGWLAAAVLFWTPRPAEAYIDGGPATLGGLCVMSSHIVAVKIEKFSEANRVLSYRKVAGLKGKIPGGPDQAGVGPQPWRKARGPQAATSRQDSDRVLVLVRWRL